MDIQDRNQKIIDAVIRKAQVCFSDSLAAVGIYGSFARDDYNEQSDLDLLILINDDRGWQLGSGFIQDDIQVGHDIYCTTWKELEEEAAYENPNISKLLDSDMIYFADDKYRERLEKLRKRVRDILTVPLSMMDFEKAEKSLKEAKICFADAMLAKAESDINRFTGKTIYCLQNALMLLNKDYFKLGMKDTCDELDALKYKPDHIGQLINNVVKSGPEHIKTQLAVLLSECDEIFNQFRKALTEGKQKPGPNNLTGTYEEFYSNWRSKMYQAAKTGNSYLSFMSMANALEMFKDIEGNVDISAYELMEGYEPENLQKNAELYERFLKHYQEEYHKVGMEVKHYPSVEAFLKDYLKDIECRIV